MDFLKESEICHSEPSGEESHMAESKLDSRVRTDIPVRLRANAVRPYGGCDVGRELAPAVFVCANFRGRAIHAPTDCDLPFSLCKIRPCSGYVQSPLHEIVLYHSIVRLCKFLRADEGAGVQWTPLSEA